VGSKGDFPSSLVDGEEGEMGGCYTTLQLNKQGRYQLPRVGPQRVQGAARLLFPKIAKSRRTVVETGETDYCTLPLQLNDSFNDNVMTALSGKIRGPELRAVLGILSGLGLNGRTKSDSELPEGKTGERGVPLRVQEPVAGRGKYDKEIGLGSLSPGSDTVYRARMYVIVDPEVEQNGSLEVESRLQPKITKTVLNNQFDQERSFQIMMEDLLRHREAIQTSQSPLILKEDVLRLRLIANKRMAYLTETYRCFKDTVSETDKDIIALMRVHMKRCIMQYNALIPQLDLIKTQWGISIEAVPSQEYFGSPKLKSGRNQRDSEHIEQARPREQLLVKDSRGLRDCLQEALKEGKPQLKPTKAAPYNGHLLPDRQTLLGDRNKRQIREDCCLQKWEIN
jgi:hypothetical protein